MYYIFYSNANETPRRCLFCTKIFLQLTISTSYLHPISSTSHYFPTTQPKNNTHFHVPWSQQKKILIVDAIQLVNATQVLLQHVLVRKGLVAVFDRALVTVRHLVDAVLVQGQRSFPGEHLWTKQEINIRYVLNIELIWFKRT